MNADKRRGGAAPAAGTSSTAASGGSHLIRAGQSPTKRQSQSTTGNMASTGANTGGMPAMPPRAAMANASSSPDGVHEAATTSGGALLNDRKEKDTNHKEKPGQHDGESVPASSSAKTPVSRKKPKESSATTAVLREKDEKIAYLEKEITIMEREFQRELDKFSQNESETATFWQAKHSTLNQQFLRTDTELRLLQAKHDVREGEREELKQRLEVLGRELKSREDEVRQLRGQVRGLKEFVSMSTRSDGQASDEVFGDGMARLGNGLQNWVIVNFRKSKIDLAKVDEATLVELSELVPMYEELVHTSKVHLLQSIVSKILVQMIFDAYYPGLSNEDAIQFRNMEDLLATLSSEESINQWRSSTLALLRREAPDSLRSESCEYAEGVLARINRLLDALTTSGPASSSSPAAPLDSRSSALRVLVNNSVELARLLVVQKAVLKVYMPEILPHQRVMFEAETMEDIGGEDEEELTEREICCVVFPGVIKRGDENGGQMQFTNVISKARVLCSPEV